MDSGTSGSLQSSSGGEDEHDSRPQRFSSGLVGPTAKPPNPPPKHPPFDPFSNFFDPSPANPIQSQSVTPTPMPITPIQLQLPNEPQPPSRNPRKRTRASRRAPTTVLTTDTSNFRAMVQEFTGIPAPPFTPASPFSRPRLDNVFGGSSSTSSTPPYLLRPFPQKLSPFLSPPPPPNSDFLLPKHTPNPIPSIFNLHPNINLHVSLDAAAQTTLEPNRNPLRLPLPEELLLSGNVPDGGGGGGSWGGGSDQGDLFRSMNAKYSTGGTKLNSNSLASSSSNLDFHGDKGSENVTNRSEGMIESWICSSD